MHRVDDDAAPIERCLQLLAERRKVAGSREGVELGVAELHLSPSQLGKAHSEF
jgi:hypothetical protein